VPPAPAVAPAALTAPPTSRWATNERLIRSRRPLPVFAAMASLAFLLVTMATPLLPSQADPLPASAHRGSTQTVLVGADAIAAVSRDSYAVTAPPPPPPVVVAKKSSSAPAAGIPDPGTAQAIALSILQARGMGEDQFDCLVSLWNRESHWNVYASNASGAYGIPQALPGSKMASAGDDWATNPATQITWGLGYITGRYGDPCGAWAHSQSSGWY
jgi:hypothetical protein